MNAPSETVVAAEALHKRYVLPRESLFQPPAEVFALNGVDLEIRRGRSFGVVGESGCGKSTLARVIMGLERPSSGSVRILGQSVYDLGAEDLRGLRRHFQMVFQDPYGSLDPRHKVGRIVAEPLDALEKIEPDVRRDRIVGALESVGLKAGDTDKYPHEFSGGQRQRIAIARALITRPAIIIADEPVSALDVSVQAQVLNLLQDLQAELGVTYMLISHDLAVVDYVCDDVAVMYLGQIVEQAPVEQVFSTPRHPYTKALLAAVPRPVAGRRRRRSQLQGGVTSQMALAVGCPFSDRCPEAQPRCQSESPALRSIAENHRVSCHFA